MLSTVLPAACTVSANKTQVSCPLGNLAQGDTRTVYIRLAAKKKIVFFYYIFITKLKFIEQRGPSINITNKVLLTCSNSPACKDEDSATVTVRYHSGCLWNGVPYLYAFQR
jgi:hypothetical protein